MTNIIINLRQNFRYKSVFIFDNNIYKIKLFDFSTILLSLIDADCLS